MTGSWIPEYVICDEMICRRSRVQFLCVGWGPFCVEFASSPRFLWVLRFPPQLKTCLIGLLSSQCPWSKALMKIQIRSPGAAQWNSLLRISLYIMCMCPMKYLLHLLMMPQFVTLKIIFRFSFYHDCTKNMLLFFEFRLVLYVKVKFKQNSAAVQINGHVQQSRRHGFEPTVPSASTDRANGQLKHLFRFWAN